MPYVLVDAGAAKMKMSNLPEHCKPVCQRRCLPCVQVDAVLAVSTLSLRCLRNFPEGQLRRRVSHKFAWIKAEAEVLKSTLPEAHRGLCHICSAMLKVKKVKKNKSLRKNSACLRSNLLREGYGSDMQSSAKLGFNLNRSDKKHLHPGQGTSPILV